MKPPKINFITKIYHPNVGNLSGKICVSILNDWWSPTFTMPMIFLSITSLLYDPNFEQPLFADIADVYKKDPEKFFSTAKEWTLEFARTNQEPN